MNDGWHNAQEREETASEMAIRFLQEIVFIAFVFIWIPTFLLIINPCNYVYKKVVNK